MPELTAEGKRKIAEVAGRHGVSPATAEGLFAALLIGGGSQAQFNLPELGGMGQWSRGGMVMVGDMFNNALKARVDALCSEFAGLAASGVVAMAQAQSQGGPGVSLFVAGSGSDGGWWPAELGTPSSTGAQNDTRYAFFPQTRRLAIAAGGTVTVYDTADHRLRGFAQQQSGDSSLTFTSQHGLVRVADLAVVAPASGPPTAAPTAETPVVPPPGPSAGPAGQDDILGKIERLADLHARGILTADEFEAKKTDLLGRL